MEQVEAKPPQTQSQGTPPAIGPTIDIVSKSVAAFAIVLYCCGYLITSIHHSSYGFIETSPFRPRIASAGAWFLLFAAIPIALVTWIKGFEGKSVNHGQWLRRLSTRLFFYGIFSFAFGTVLQGVFDFHAEDRAKDSIWALIIPPLILVACMILVILDQVERFPKAIAPIASIIFVGFFLVSGYREVFLYHRTADGAVTYWFLAAGGLIASWMWVFRQSGSRILEPGSWPMVVSFAISALVLFGSSYYPHIKSSWGGGAPVPITIFFTKDSTIMPNQSVSALLVDESDTGLYVVGKNDKKATFIPRSAVGLVYYSDDISGFSFAKPK